MLRPDLYDGPEKFDARKKYVANKYPYLSWQSKVENMSPKQIETLFVKFQDEEAIEIAREIVKKYEEDSTNGKKEEF